MQIVIAYTNIISKFYQYRTLSLFFTRIWKDADHKTIRKWILRSTSSPVTFDRCPDSSQC